MARQVLSIFRKIRHSENHIGARDCIYIEQEQVYSVTQLNDELEGLKKEEQTLEEMRAMVAPEHWPRIYAMLKRIRERMQQIERPDKDTSKSTAA